MIAKKSLNKRDRGFEFSGTEYTLIFEKDNIGFVRFDCRSKNKFYLDPSPFLKTPKNEIYVLENIKCTYPENGDLIEVITTESESVINGSYGAFKRTKIKYVHNWIKLNPSAYIRNKGMQPEDYIDFFNRPFSGATEYMEQLSFCLALCTMSSPTIGCNGKGGIDSGIHAKESSWGSFKRLMALIPPEFRKTTSRFYYNQLDKERNFNYVNSEEINIALRDPLNRPVHIPIAFNIEIKEVSKYKEELLYEIPFIRAYLLDSLMFKPESPSKKVESHLINLINDMVSDFTNANAVFCDQDLGSAVPKLCDAFARLRLTEKISKTEVDECGTLWMDMFHHSNRLASSNLSPRKLFKFTSQALQLYLDLENSYGVNVHIPVSDIANVTNINLWEIEEEIANLRKKGLIYSPNNEVIVLLDFTP